MEECGGRASGLTSVRRVKRLQDLEVTARVGRNSLLPWRGLGDKRKEGARAHWPMRATHRHLRTRLAIDRVMARASRQYPRGGVELDSCSRATRAQSATQSHLSVLLCGSGSAQDALFCCSIAASKQQTRRKQPARRAPCELRQRPAAGPDGWLAVRSMLAHDDAQPIVSTDIDRTVGCR